MMTPEELVVGRRNLVAQLRVLAAVNAPTVAVDQELVRDLIEVLDQPEGDEPLPAYLVQLLHSTQPLLGTRPQPTLDRDAVCQVLVSFGAGIREEAASPTELLSMAVNAILSLVRPLPTREQIAEALHREKHSETCMFNNPSNCDQFRQSIQEAEALNLLFSGGEE